MKKRLAILLAAVVLIAAALVAYYRGSRGEETPAFEMARITRGDVVETVDATGTLEGGHDGTSWDAGLRHDQGSAC